jgi:hypothetical protein
VYVPVSLRAERLGVLRVRLAGATPPDVLAGLLQVATVTAYVVFGAGRFTDMYEQARRREPLALDAEMQWNLLPVRAFAGPHFEIAGQLMPAYEVGGGDEQLQGTLLATTADPPHEAVREVLRTVSAYQRGSFRDDATALCLDWYGAG